MLSPELLTANIAALTKAQGTCPTLGALSQRLRVAIAGNAVHAELHTDSAGWQRVDSPITTSSESTWMAGHASSEAQVILVGAGLGHALAVAERRRVKRILAIEPHPGLATLLLSQRDWRPWIDQGRLRLLTGPDYAGAADVARFLDGLSDIAIVAHPLRERWEPGVIARAMEVAAGVSQNAKANGNARRRFAGPYLLQTLANLHAIGREADVRSLAGQFTGVPAVVVGAGPSLDRNAPDLIPLQDRALIVSADTALGPLLAHGVRPHLAVAVDSSALNARHLTTWDQTEGVALAAEGSVHPSALDRFAGRTFTFRVSQHEPWPWLQAAGIARGEVRTWGLVLTSAFNLARGMGCDPIVFIGADMAFTGMRPYCRGTIYDAMWQEWIDKGCTWDALMEEYFSRQPELWQPDVHGETTRTAPHLLSFRDWLVEQTKTAVSGRFVNATGGGILHGGRLQHMRLGDALGDAPRLDDVAATIAARHAASIGGGDGPRLADLLQRARRHRGAVPIDRWIQFAAGTITREQIQAALGTDRV